MAAQSGLTTWSVKGNSWFLGIGIDDYRHFPKLHNAVKDVGDVHRILLEQYDVEKEHSILLFNADADEGGVIAKLEYLAEQITPDDKLLIYYSGHGYVNPGTGLAYWIPADAQKGRSADYIANSTIRDHLAVIKARHILLISDSCFSGTLFLRGGARSSRATEELGRIPSRWALCSGRAGEEVEDGAPGTNSPFTSSVIEALSENIYDEWNVSRLIDRVREQTAASARQVPDGSPLRIDGHKGGQYVFLKKGAKPTSESGTHSQATIATQGPRSTATRSTTAQSKRNLRIGLWITGVLFVLIAAYFLFQRDAPAPPAELPPGVIVHAFHTTTAVNENLWPANQRDRFEVRKPVFVYGNVVSPEPLELTISFSPLGTTEVMASQEVHIWDDESDGGRFSAYHIFEEGGTYTVTLGFGETVMARDTFLVFGEQ